MLPARSGHRPKRFRQEPRRVRIFAVAVVVQHQAPAAVVGVQRLRGGAGRLQFGRGELARAECGDQLAEAQQAVVAGDGQRQLIRSHMPS